MLGGGVFPYPDMSSLSSSVTPPTQPLSKVLDDRRYDLRNALTRNGITEVDCHMDVQRNSYDRRKAYSLYDIPSLTAANETAPVWSVLSTCLYRCLSISDSESGIPLRLMNDATVGTLVTWPD